MNNKTSQQEQMDFYIKIGKYMQTHPEFVAELEERIADEENPQREKGVNYFIKKKLRRMGGNPEEISEWMADFLFKDAGKDSWFRGATQNYLKDIVSGYFSEYLGK
ncbi:MAG: hypothetical protein ACP5N2_05915 [Candidatus Nanoarchaeia archaeon]